MATDMGRVTEVQDMYGTILTRDDEIRVTWPCHFDGRLNVKNEGEYLEGILPAQGTIV